MQQRHEKQIQKIMSEMECRKDFECYKSGFENMSKVNDIGLEGFVECLKENAQECELSVSFGYSWFCRCPLRIYVAKTLNK